MLRLFSRKRIIIYRELEIMEPATGEPHPNVHCSSN
jgi:hypothetical protein